MILTYDQEWYIQHTCIVIIVMHKLLLYPIIIIIVITYIYITHTYIGTPDVHEQNESSIQKRTSVPTVSV
jgi:hypothetical protein